MGSLARSIPILVLVAALGSCQDGGFHYTNRFGRDRPSFGGRSAPGRLQGNFEGGRPQAGGGRLVHRVSRCLSEAGTNGGGTEAAVHCFFNIQDVKMDVATCDSKAETASDETPPRRTPRRFKSRRRGAVGKRKMMQFVDSLCKKVNPDNIDRAANCSTDFTSTGFTGHLTKGILENLAEWSKEYLEASEKARDCETLMEQVAAKYENSNDLVTNKCYGGLVGKCIMELKIDLCVQDIAGEGGDERAGENFGNPGRVDKDKFMSALSCVFGLPASVAAAIMKG